MDVMRDANERAATGEDVIHLEVGQPSTPAPRRVLEAAKWALDTQVLGYTDALGIPPLREKIAGYYQTRYGLSIDPGRVIATTGSSGGFLLAFLSAFDVGDKVGLATPSYPAYKNILAALGLHAVDIPVGPSSHFQPTPEILEPYASELDGLIIASPSNPTGSMIDAAGMKALALWCGRSDIRLISDEIYHGITYGDAAETALAHSHDVVVVNSFSKYFSMTGWRLGWMVVPENMLRAVECLAQNLFISPPSLSQTAVLEVFDCFDELDENVARYAVNRNLLLTELPRAGIDSLAPSDGAFYIYADVSHLTDDSTKFCRRLLAETGVAITPGADFDNASGQSFIRMCYAGEADDIAGAASRLKDWLS
ncbi:MAG: aminotransferase class I/II-fold pyridoxal phosphate-dependent enzyme [Rhodospirillales bacterium]|nr:aminotransferase class I/II-fold pyridoxal phosphate-dependent enzyme [Rhodospirillales bacterium]